MTKTTTLALLNSSSHDHSLKLILLLVFVLIFVSDADQPENLVKEHHKVSGVLVFGDSTSDPGNNNYIPTIFKGNFRPYGKDFANHVPTGRFTNGLLASDYVARYLGLKDNVPPYLDPSLSIHDLMTGVSFASAGSGYDPLTPTISNVISLPRQLEYFKEYKARMITKIGKTKTKQIINNSLYLLSAGTNDFVVNYFTLPIRRQEYDLPSYMSFVLKTQLAFLQALWDEGARKIVVAGLPPMGCLPIVITLFSKNAIHDRGCIDFFSSVARTYNSMLQTHLMQFHHAHESGRIAYFDTYSPLLDAIVGHKYGFKEVRLGCCGTGLLEATFLCNPNSKICSDASKYAFWDSIHPTQEMYKICFKAFQPTIDQMLKG